MGEEEEGEEGREEGRGGGEAEKEEEDVGGEGRGRKRRGGGRRGESAPSRDDKDSLTLHTRVRIPAAATFSSRLPHLRRSTTGCAAYFPVAARSLACSSVSTSTASDCATWSRRPAEAPSGFWSSMARVLTPPFLPALFWVWALGLMKRCLQP